MGEHTPNKYKLDEWLCYVYTFVVVIVENRLNYWFGPLFWSA